MNHIDAFIKGFKFARAWKRLMKKLSNPSMAQDDWVTLTNKEGEQYKVDLPGKNPSESSGKSKNSSGKTSNKESRQLEKIDREALEHYVSGNGMYINKSLREKRELDDSDKEFIRDLDNALDAKVEDKVLYRSIDAPVLINGLTPEEYHDYLLPLFGVYGESMKNHMMQNISPYQEQKIMGLLQKLETTKGKTYTEKGYMSTTRDSDIAERFKHQTGAEMPVVMRIKTNERTLGRDVSDLSDYVRQVEARDPQKETLLARGQKYKIRKIYPKNGNLYFDVELE